MYLLNSPTIAMIWSLIPHVEQNPNKFDQKELYPICHEKLLEKGLSILYGKDTIPLLHWKIMWEYMFPQYLQKSTY